MAECTCGNCEHCGVVASDAYAPDAMVGVAVTDSVPLPDDPRFHAVTVVHPSPASSGCVVRDLTDAIRGLALANATGHPIEMIMADALALARHADETHVGTRDGTHGCDVCRALRAAAGLVLTKETVVDIAPPASKPPPTL